MTVDVQSNPKSRTILRQAAPFWIGALAPFILAVGAFFGGIWTFLAFNCMVYTHALVDAVIDHNKERMSENAPDQALKPYDIVLKFWVVIQSCVLIGFILYVPNAGHLNWLEELLLAATLGASFGLIGINYAHELMHRGQTLTTWMSDFLLAMACYGHFRTEHIQGHHIHVATPLDPATARLGETFWKFFPRVVKGTWRSAFRIERAKLQRQGLPWWHHKNPFWRYWALQAGFTILVLTLGGLHGLALWWIAVFHAIVFLELTNYMEHYGLTRIQKDNGKYEATRPHHSWNSNERVSNWVLINLQRHSDHHYKPSRHFAMLEAYDENIAPQLPHGYSLMGFYVVFMPRYWHKIMDPKVHQWRKDFYPDIVDWPSR